MVYILTEFVRPLSLVKKIIVLDGLTGTGKTMFSPLIASLEGVQNPRFEYMFEFLAISGMLKKVTPDACTSLLKLLVDNKYYDSEISREVNFRPTDLSSVFSNGNGLRYLRNLFLSDGAEAVVRLEKTNPAFSIVTHQLLSCLDVLNQTFSDKLRVVEMVRHPLFLLDHWGSYIGMHGKNARDFTIWLNCNGQSVPWFAKGWEEKYATSTPSEQVIYSIDALMSPVFACAENKSISNVMFIPFERFVLAPEPFIGELEVFLDTPRTQSTSKHLRRQCVPRKNINLGPVKKIYKRYGVEKQKKLLSHRDDYLNRLAAAQNEYSPESFDVLLKCIQRYETCFGIWFTK